MADLTDKEQAHVRTALRFLRRAMGGWKPLAAALRIEYDTLQKVAAGKRAVSPAVALRLARLVNMPFDELLAGLYVTSRTCPFCGHPPMDFEDEETEA